MSVYKVTIGIGQTVMGATESYYTPDRADSQVATLINGLLAARNKLLYDSVFWTGVRISLYNSRRRSQMFIPGLTPFLDTGVSINVPGTGGKTGVSLPFREDQFRATMQWIAKFDVDRTTIRYMSGIPDAISATEPLTVDTTGDAKWFSDMLAFYALLVSAGWQIRAKLKTGDNTPWPVLGVQSQPIAPFEVGIKVLAMGAPAFTVGAKVSLARFRAAKGVRAATMNGDWHIDSIDTGSAPGYLIIYLRGSANIDASAQRFTADTTIQLVGYGLYPILKAYYNRVGIHKRGRPLGALRGRRLIRPSLER